MSQDCIFCKIIAGDSPCTRVHEDAHALAFLDIGPVVKGHTLVVPKIHSDPVTETPPETLQHLIVVVQKIARAQIDGLGADGINVSQANGACAGQVVPHLHFHVIPRFLDDGCSFNWTPGKYDSAEEMTRYSEKMRAALASA